MALGPGPDLGDFMQLESRKTVLVTGASSGIGHATVGRMARDGWFVFASVRKTADGDRLRAEFPGNVMPVILDVTDRTTIASAAEQVGEALKSRGGADGLDGLANNAGIGIVGPLEFVDLQELREIFEINVFGQVAVIQAFLPAIRRVCGRIVNISSIGAHIALPFGGLLNASKAAFGILSDTLRLEMRMFGIHVATIEPGAIKTPAVAKTVGDVEGAIAKLPARGAEEYAALLRKFMRQVYEREMEGSGPEVVAEAVHKALTAKRPRIRYRVGKHARVLTALPEILPDAWLDLLRMKMMGLPTEFGAMKSA